MNPRLIKFMVELQNQAQAEKTEENISLDKNNGCGFFERLFSKKAPVTVPINRTE